MSSMIILKCGNKLSSKKDFYGGEETCQGIIKVHASTLASGKQVCCQSCGFQFPVTITTELGKAVHTVMEMKRSLTEWKFDLSEAGLE